MGKDMFRDGCRVSMRVMQPHDRYLPMDLAILILMFVFFFHQKYLKDFYFKNAKTANFWASLANVCFILNILEKNAYFLLLYYAYF